MRCCGLIAVVCCVLIANGCGSSGPVAAESATPAVTLASFDPAAPTTSFNVPQMACEDHCAKVVKQTLEKLPGAKAVEVEFETKTVRVNVEENAFDADAAMAKLAEEGYDETTLISSTN